MYAAIIMLAFAHGPPDVEETLVVRGFGFARPAPAFYDRGGRFRFEEERRGILPWRYSRRSFDYDFEPRFAAPRGYYGRPRSFDDFEFRFRRSRGGCGPNGCY